VKKKRQGREKWKMREEKGEELRVNQGKKEKKRKEKKRKKNWGLMRGDKGEKGEGKNY
jgi:hypothetical protein